MRSKVKTDDDSMPLIIVAGVAGVMSGLRAGQCRAGVSSAAKGMHS